MMTRSTWLLIVLGLALGAAGCDSSTPTYKPGSDPTLMNPELEKPGPRVGERAPTIELRNAQGELVDLGALYAARAPVVVTFYRGGWCPYCNRALASWGAKLDELQDAGGVLVAISPETAEHSLATAEKAGIDAHDNMISLVDQDGVAMRAFKAGFAVDERTQRRYRGFGIDLDSWNANGKWELPAPITAIIDSEGAVRWVYSDWDYEKRADPDDVIAEVRRVAR